MDSVILASEHIVKAMKAGNKLLVFGNGGSAAQAQHLCAEFVGHEPPLAAISLTTDTSAITAIGNDLGFTFIFEQQIRALCRKGDVVLGISTSGKSINVIRAITMAAKLGAYTIALTGWQSNPLKQVATLSIRAGSRNTQRIQDEHSVICHRLMELVFRGF